MRTVWEEIDDLSNQLEELRNLQKTKPWSEEVDQKCRLLGTEIHQLVMEAQDSNDNNAPRAARINSLFASSRDTRASDSKEASQCDPVEAEILKSTQQVKGETVDWDRLLALGLAKPFTAHVLQWLRDEPRSILNLRASCRIFRAIIPDQERINALNKLLNLKALMPILERYHRNPISPTQETKTNQMLLKCVFVGDTMTGKTSFTKRYADPSYVLSRFEKATTGVDFCLKSIFHGSFELVVQMWDLAGQERFGTMTQVYYRDTKLFFIVFDVTRRATFDSIMNWAETINRNNAMQDATKILLANSCSASQEKWACTKEEITNMCKAFNISLWFEVDTHKNINIEKSMEESLALHLRSRIFSEHKIKLEIPKLQKIPDPQHGSTKTNCLIL